MQINPTLQDSLLSSFIELSLEEKTLDCLKLSIYSLFNELTTLETSSPLKYGSLYLFVLPLNLLLSFFKTSLFLSLFSGFLKKCLSSNELNQLTF